MDGLYCEHVIRTGESLNIPNALKDEFWKNNPDIELGMICYYGLPVYWPDREVFGTICMTLVKPKYRQKFKKIYRNNLISKI